MVTKADLDETVLDRLNRQDLGNFVKGWHRSACNHINRIMRVGEMLENVMLEFGGPMELPDDFLEISQIKVLNAATDGGYGAMRAAPYDVLADEYRPGNDQYRLSPGLISIKGKTLTIGRFTGDGAVYKIGVEYFARWPVLDEPTDTNWLLNDAPHIYENAMLIFGHRHILEFDTADRMEAMVMQDIVILNEAYKNSLTAGMPLVMNSARKIGGRKS